MTSEQHELIHAPRDRLLHHSRRYRTNPMVLPASVCPLHRTFNVLLHTDLFTTRLRCVETSRPRVCSLAPRSHSGPLRLHLTVNASPRQAPPDHLCCVRLHVSRDSRLVSTRCTLVFWLSVRLNVNLHDVLNLSSISINVLDSLSISIEVLDLLSISTDVLDLSFP